MNIMLCGPITARPNTYRAAFAAASDKMTEYAHMHGEEAYIFNPALLPNAPNLSGKDYLRITEAMIDCCDTVFFLEGWEESPGANHEMTYARAHKKRILSDIGRDDK